MSVSMEESWSFIDFHYHASPDLYKRRHSSLEAGRLYQRLGGAVVLRSHIGSTASVASIAQSEGLPVLGSVALNACNGGLCYKTVLRALYSYGDSFRLVVDFPTLTGRLHQSALTRAPVHPSLFTFATQAERVCDEEGRLRSGVEDMFRLCRDYPLLLTSGHASFHEIQRLCDLASSYAVPFVLNQPAHPLSGCTYETLEDLVRRYPDVWCEQTVLTRLLAYQGEDDFLKTLSALPRTLYSSDLGQTTTMDVEAWRNFSKVYFRDNAISEEREKALCYDHPLRLLRL